MKFTKDYLLFLGTAIIGFIIVCSILLVEHIIVHNYFSFESSGYYAFIIALGFFLALLLGFILTGFIAAYFFFNKCVSKTNGIIISASAGILAVFLLSFVLFNLQFLVIVGCVGGMGAYLFSLIDQSSQNANQESEKHAGKMIGVRTTVILFIFSILLCMVVPLGISYAALVSGADIGECLGCIQMWEPQFTTNISRVDASSINLIVMGNYSLHEPSPLSNEIDPLRLPMQITIDGKDFSNQSVIRQQGLNDTMTPPEGISVYRNGISILITGPDIIKNGSIGRHVLVTCHSVHDHALVVLDKVI